MLNFKRSVDLFRGTLSALLATTICGISISNESAYAQRAANLFTMCKSTTRYLENITGSPIDVVIGRELFTAVGYMTTHRYNSITCRVRPSNSAYKYKTLRLAFGMEDDTGRYRCSRPVTVNVYLDGNLQESRSLLPSEAALLILPISTVSSVAIEATNNNCDSEGSVYFTQAILEPISTSPGKRY